MTLVQELGWKNKSSARKIVVFVTDAAPHIAGDARVNTKNYSVFFMVCNSFIIQITVKVKNDQIFFN